MIAPRDYAKAVIESGVSDEKIANLIRAIRKNGDWSRRGKIIAAIEAAERMSAGKSLAVIESARQLTASQRAMIAEKFSEQKFDTEYRANPEVIAGVRIEINGESQIDTTLAATLRKIFNKK